MATTQDLRPADTTPTPYAAIIYFHGMGTPRRHEEISRLTDALDQFSSELDEGSVGRLREQKVFLEPSRVDNEDEDDVAFVQITRLVRRFGNRYRREGSYRIYEGYWSSYVAGETSAFRVFWWLLGRFSNPIGVLRNSWRAHQRLKLTTLYRMSAKNNDPANDIIFRELESFYISYENWAARRRHPTGSFQGYLDEIESKLKGAPAKLERAFSLARKWRQRFHYEQALIFGVTLTVGAGAASAILFLIFFIISISRALGFSEFVPPTVPQLPWPQFLLPLGAFILVFALVKVRRYLSTFWSDVMFWTTQEEKDSRFAKRREILRAATRTITHVLRDLNCERIVVVGHSLGSAIAYESLLRLGRRYTARKNKDSLPIELERLGIISHMVTIGSPIDRIHYFFELHDSQFHRYNRIRDALKGSTANPPFLFGKVRGAHWINIWDDADAISSRLFSPRGRLPNREAITDIWSPSSYWPDPVQAHSAYYVSAKSMHALFWITMFGRLPQTQSEAGLHSKWEAIIFRYVRPAIKLLAISLIWSSLICGLVFLFSDASWHVLIAPLLTIAVLVVVRALCWFADGAWSKKYDSAKT